MMEPWLPRNYEIRKGVEVKKLGFAGKSWQICLCVGGASILVAKERLARFWTASRLLDSTALDSFRFGGKRLFFLASPPGMLLVPASFHLDCVSYEDGKSFALALAASREILPRGSFAGGVFVERCARLLPDDEDTTKEADDILLGRWLSRGTEVSAGSIQRMLQLVPSITKEGLEDILKAARMAPLAADDANDVAGEKAAAAPVKPKKTFVLPGRRGLEAFFRDYVIDIVENPEEYQRMGIDFPSAFILQGPPGCGKTYAVEKLVDYLQWPCFRIDSGSIGSPFIHETSKKISEIFEEAMRKTPSVLIIDEMEAFLSSRRDASSNGHHVEEVAEFLRKIPEASKNHVLVIAMTNMIASIDPAIRRKGRFDHIVEVGMPSKEEILAVLENGLEKIPHADIDLMKISETLVGRPISDVSFALREAARITAKAHRKHVSSSAFASAISAMKKNENAEGRSIGFLEGDGR